MAEILPHRFLFRYSIPIPRVNRIPKSGRKLLDLPEKCTVPDFGELDEELSFAKLKCGWNGKGLGVSIEVQGKQHPVSCDANQLEESDGVRLWIDTRNTQSIHRASRFCHQFCFLPAGNGKKKSDPIAVQLPIARAREETPICKPADLRTSVEIRSDGYRLDAWMPATVLNGFDPDDNLRLGFYFHIHDSELGDQFLTIGHEFPFAYDPSLWATLELQS